MISVDDIKKLASLARINVTQDELENLATDMENILGYVEQIQKVSGSFELPKEQVRNVLRDDAHAHESGVYTEKILYEAPEREGEYVKVKKIL